MKIRKATEKDIPVIIEYNRSMARETENHDLPVTIISEGVRNLFQHPEYGFYIVAEENGRVVGCLMITYEWTDWRNGLFWWIQSVYVHPEYRRKGVYRKMYQFIKAQAQNEKFVRGFRLYVEKENKIAQKTYISLGMAESRYLLFEELL
jgi:ribosomal protein S18 acetylase RimI-like enzyme